jgi:hypothetical protein
MSLIEIYWNLVEKFGFSSNWFDSRQEKGNMIILDLVLKGLMIQPCNPSTLQARDAIIASARADIKCDVWKGFAKRGFGVDAKDDFTNGFTLPAECIGSTSDTMASAGVDEDVSAPILSLSSSTPIMEPTNTPVEVNPSDSTATSTSADVTFSAAEITVSPVAGEIVEPSITPAGVSGADITPTPKPVEITSSAAEIFRSPLSSSTGDIAESAPSPTLPGEITTPSITPVVVNGGDITATKTSVQVTTTGVKPTVTPTASMHYSSTTRNIGESTPSPTKIVESRTTSASPSPTSPPTSIVFHSSGGPTFQSKIVKGVATKISFDTVRLTMICNTISLCYYKMFREAVCTVHKSKFNGLSEDFIVTFPESGTYNVYVESDSWRCSYSDRNWNRLGYSFTVE